MGSFLPDSVKISFYKTSSKDKTKSVFYITSATSIKKSNSSLKIKFSIKKDLGTSVFYLLEMQTPF